MRSKASSNWEVVRGDPDDTQTVRNLINGRLRDPCRPAPKSAMDGIQPTSIPLRHATVDAREGRRDTHCEPRWRGLLTIYTALSVIRGHPARDRESNEVQGHVQP